MFCCCHDTLQTVLCCLHQFCTEVQRTSVVRTQHKETQYLKIIFFSDLTYSKEVPKRFGHFAVINIQKAVVQPVFGKIFSVGSLTLCNLIFVMREDQILSTGMNVNLLSQILFGHFRALDVPSRTPFTPW